MKDVWFLVKHLFTMSGSCVASGKVVVMCVYGMVSSLSLPCSPAYLSIVALEA